MKAQPSLYHLFRILTYAIPVTGNPGAAYSLFSLQLRSDLLLGAIAPDFHCHRLAMPFTPHILSSSQSLTCSLVTYSSTPVDKIQIYLAKIFFFSSFSCIAMLSAPLRHKDSLLPGTLLFRILRCGILNNSVIMKKN